MVVAVIPVLSMAVSADMKAVVVKPGPFVMDLSGEWKFIPSDRSDFSDPDFPDADWDLVYSGDSWTSSEKYSGYEGDAWYRRDIRFDRNPDRDYSLFLSWQGRGSRVYFNGSMLGETRSFDASGRSEPIVGKPTLVYIPASLIRPGRNVLAIRTGILNYLGGLGYPLIFGDSSSVKEKCVMYVMWNSFLSAVNIFLFIYFLFMYGKRRNEKYYLYFSILSLSLGLWILGYRGLVLFIADSQLAFILATYACSVIAPLMFICFMFSFLGIRTNRAFAAFTAVYAILLLFLVTEMIFTGGIKFYQKYCYMGFMLVTTLTIIYALWLAFDSVKKKRPFSRRILLSVALFGIAYVMSLLSFLDITTMEPVLLEGFFLMTAIFASILASRFALVHSDLERSNVILLDINREKDSAIENLNIYKNIVSASRDHMAFIDGRGRFVEANEAFLKSFKKDRLEIIGGYVRNVLGEKDYSSQFGEHFEKCLSGQEVVFERWFHFPSGGGRYMVTALYPYVSPNKKQNGVVYYSMDMTERMNLEREMVSISEKERNSLGIELHDGLSQNLFGIALKANLLAKDLGTGNGGEGARAAEIERLINRAIESTRSIAKSLATVDFDEGGLVTQMKELKRLLEKRYDINLEIDVDPVIEFSDKLVYAQAYYIIQEAVTNSVKHSRAKNIGITLKKNEGDIHLGIFDDGIGIPRKLDEKKGIGIRIMNYRARMIGASLSIKKARGGGTEVRCVIPG